MLIEFSVILGFSTLFISSVFDVKSEKGDVPAVILLLGIAGGFLLHLIHTVLTGNPEALYFSLAGGIIFTSYGFLSYVMDMWGGADMLGISVLGFSSTYFLMQLNGIVSLLDLFINMMGIAFFYALIFGFSKGLRSESTRKSFIENIRTEKTKFSLLTGLGLLFLVLTDYSKSLLVFLCYEFMVIVYFFFQSVEEELMTEEIEISDLETGDVVSFEGIDLQQWREQNILGNFLIQVQKINPSEKANTWLETLEKRYGYSEIVGLTEEGLETLNDSDLEAVEIKQGIRFMPVFPIALVLTVYGFSLLLVMIQLF